MPIGDDTHAISENSGTLTTSKILHCRSPAAYLASVLDEESVQRSIGGSFFPLLSTDEDSNGISLRCVRGMQSAVYAGSKSLHSILNEPLTHTIAICEELSRSSTCHADPACVILQTDDTALLGAAYALLSRKRLVVVNDRSQLATVTRDIEESRSVTFVASPPTCAQLGCDRIRDWLTSDSRQRQPSVSSINCVRRPWGILTSQNQFSLSRLFARTQLHSLNELPRGAIYRTDVIRPPIDALDDLLEVDLPNHPSDKIMPLLTSPVDFAAFVGHGRSYCALGGNLCSLTDAAKAGDLRCIGDYQCVFADQARIPARAILADVVFVDSCSTACFGAVGPEANEGANLALHMLNGQAAAVIAAYRANTPLTLSPYLAWHLLGVGETVGEICSRLNCFTASLCQVDDAFLLIGDPELAICSKSRLSVRELFAEPTSVGVWRLMVPASPRRVQSYVCKDADLVRSAKESSLHVLEINGASDSSILAVLPKNHNDDALDIVALWGRGNVEPNVSVDVTTRPPVRDTIIKMVSRVLENVVAERSLVEAENVTETNSVTTCVADFEAYLNTVEGPLASRGGVRVASSEDYKTLLVLERDLVAKCRDVCAKMIDALRVTSRNRPVWLYSEYLRTRGMRMVGDDQAPWECPYCGGNVCRRNYRVGIWPVLERALYECEYCMFICDVKVGNAPLVIDCPTLVTEDAGCEMIVRVRNLDTIPAIIDCAVVIDRMQYAAELFIVDPPKQEAFIESNSEVAMKFKVEFARGVVRHLYHAKVFVSINGSVAWGLRKLVGGAMSPCSTN